MKKRLLFTLVTFFMAVTSFSQEVTTFAGSGSYGDTDGTGAAASFRFPHGVAIDAVGNVYVADRNNYKIRIITPTGEVSTLAGSGSAGNADGLGTAASFNQPIGIAIDATGYIYVADVSNHKIRQISPRLATHFNFDGVDDFIALPNESNFDFTNQMTVEAWVKSSVAPEQWDALVTKGDNSWRLHLNSTGTVNFACSGTTSPDVNSTSSVTDGNWHHVVGTLGGNSIKIYIDGVLENVVSTSGNINNTVNQVLIGNNQTFDTRLFNGNIDEVRIWNVARTAEQINGSKNCELQGNETGLVAYYKFNQGLDAADNTAITTLTDATANVNNGTLVNFAKTGTTSNFLAGSPVTMGSTAPTASAQSFCGATTANRLVPAISATIKWYASATATTALATTDNLTTGTYYVVAVNANGCESTRTSAVITVNAIPTAPTGSAQSFCGATTANSLVPAISATIKWYASATATTALATTNNLTTRTYYVVAVNVNGCESDRVASTVTITNPQFGSGKPEILYYKFDGTGTSVPNLASAPPAGAENATILGAITQGGSGNTGGALNGSGVASTTDYLNTNWNTNLGTNSWSIAFWSSGFSSTATFYYIFGDNSAGSFRCFTDGSAGSNNWTLRGNGITDVSIYGGAVGTPSLCVFVYDNVANKIKAYLNGVLVSTVNQTAGAVNIVGTAPFKVMGYSSNFGVPVGGKLDDFGLFSRVLTLTEIQNLYQQGVQTNQEFCNGATVANLQPNTSSTVKWYASATGGTELATSEVLTTGLYYATPVIGTCEGARTTVNVTTTSNATTQNAGVVTATENASGVTYQWYQCGTPNVLLTGETNQTYTPTANGDYYVQITKGTCVVSSVCETTLGNSNFEINSGLSIYPNPSKGIFNISIQEDANVTVNDILGKVIYTKKVKAGNNTIDISNYQSGMYLLNIINENGSVTKKLIKE